MSCRALLVGISLAACGNAPAAPDAALDDAPVDEASPDASVDAALVTWETVEEISNDGSVIVERVSYRADGLRVYARQCRPAGTGPYPLAIYNHGGFYGLDLDPMTARCYQTAQFGYVWLGSSYRGEDGSEGEIEVCLGEVTDVLRMLEIARVQPYIDPTRIAMWGGSHGGCITLRALQRGANVSVAAAVFGPADIARVHQFWSARIAANDPMSSFYSQLREQVEDSAGGTPAEVPAAYTARSPQSFVADLPAAIPLLVTHGTADEIVPVTESCALVAASTGFANYHINASQQLVTTAPTDCASSGLTWSGAPHPRGTWPASRYFIAYDNLGHEIPDDDANGTEMQADIASFLMTKL